VALGNVADARALPALERVARESEPLVAEHARWAIGQIEAVLALARARGRVHCGHK
jgi:epoxyqueuosine reductase